MKVVKNFNDLKDLTKTKTQRFVKPGDSDMGIITIRYDGRTDRFIITSRSRDWAWGGTIAEMEKSTNEQIRKIPLAVIARNLMMIENKYMVT